MLLLYKSEADEGELKPPKDLLRLLISSRTTLSKEGLSSAECAFVAENDGLFPLVSG